MKEKDFEQIKELKVFRQYLKGRLILAIGQRTAKRDPNKCKRSKFEKLFLSQSKFPEIPITDEDKLLENNFQDI